MSLRRIARGRFVALPVLFAAVVALAGCAQAGGPSVRSDFLASFGPGGLGKVDTAVIDATAKLEVGGAGRSRSYQLRVSGPFQRDVGSDLTFSWNAHRGERRSLEEITTPDNLYFVDHGATYELGQRQFHRLRRLNEQQPGGPGDAIKRGCEEAIGAADGKSSVCDELHPARCSVRSQTRGPPSQRRSSLLTYVPRSTPAL
jgi:hypothetical protein